MYRDIVVVTYHGNPVFAVGEHDLEIARKYVKERIAQEFPLAAKWDSEERGCTIQFPHTPFKIHSAVRLVSDGVN